MANTLTGLIPTMYAAIDTVQRELVGFIPAVSRNSSAERAALNQSILVPITPAAAMEDNTPGVTPPDSGDNVIDNVPMTISKSKHVPIRWNGEQTLGMQNAGTYNDVLRQQFEQAFRTLCNAIEADVATAFVAASRAVGTAGTAPFGVANDLSDGAAARQVLDDNGAPSSDLHLVLGSAAMANIRGKQTVLFKVNEAGTDQLLRQGTIGELQGFMIHNSGQVQLSTPGTGTLYVANGSQAKGSTSVVLKTGSGTLVPGDVVTFAGDGNKYVVGTGIAAPGTALLNKPGLRAIEADGTALTIGGAYRANMAFHRSAIQLITRQPALPVGGDLAVDRRTITDPVSGLSFEVALYPQYRQMQIQVGIAWGFNFTKSEFICTLMG